MHHASTLRPPASHASPRARTAADEGDAGSGARVMSVLVVWALDPVFGTSRWCGGAGAFRGGRGRRGAVGGCIGPVVVLDGLRSSAASGRAGVVGRAEASMDVVVDHAEVLHERVHTRGPTKRYPCDFNCCANVSACGVDLGRSERDRGARSRVISQDFASATRLGDADSIARALSAVAW